MAKERWVYCGQCGCRFDLNRGGYYTNSTGRYTCKTCAKTVNNVSVRKPQTTGAMIAKIAVGFMFIATAFSANETDTPLTFFLTALIIGGALITWALVLYFQEKKAAKQEVLDQLAEMQEEFNAPKTCESCGATGTGDVCEYCGRPYA